MARVPYRIKTLTTSELLSILSGPRALREDFLLSFPKWKCSCCNKVSAPATGVWWCKFQTRTEPFFRSELRLLCPFCGLTGAYRVWNGFMSPKLIRVDLLYTITAPVGDKRTAADFLIEKLLEHPEGQKYLVAWKMMYRPANIHHPISPAFAMLEQIVDNLFPSDTVYTPAKIRKLVRDDIRREAKENRDV